MKLNITLILLFVFSAYAGPNKKNASKPTIDTVFSKQQYIEDIQQLSDSILKNHPRPFEFITGYEFKKLIRNKINQITNNTRYSEFIWDMSEILAAIGCGHSSFRYYFIQEDELIPDSKRFPLDVKLFNQKLFIIDPLINSNALNAGQEITEINGVETEKVITTIKKHIFSDGNLVGSKVSQFNVFANSYIAFNFNLTDSYRVKTSQSQKEIKLKNLIDYQHKPMIPKFDKCKENLCLSYLNKETARLTIRSFNYYGDKSKIFEKFIDESFISINQKRIKNLIIDVRGNGGGNTFSSAYLLAHFAAKPFVFFKEYSPSSERLKSVIEPYPNAFKGNVYMITDGGDGSTTGFLLALVKFNNFAKIIGDNSGSSFSTNAGYKDHTLKNTGIKYRISTQVATTNVDGFHHGEAITPDIKVTQTVTDYLNNKDTILDHILEIISLKQMQ